MKAAVLYNLGEDLVIRDDIELPELKAGQVLVKMFYAGVCQSQLMEVGGHRGEDRYLPHMLGHEGTGEVVDIGISVSKVKVGDNVVLGWIKGSGLDVPGTQYRTTDGEIINAGAVTTFSDYAVVSENRCIQAPEGTPLDLAVLYGCAVPTGAGIILNTLKPGKDSTIAVFGLGGIGLSVLLAIGLFDCSKVICIDVEEQKLELAKKLGATDVVNASRNDPVEKILGLTGGKGVDYSVESAGHTKTIEQAFSSVRKGGGRCVFASHPPTGAKIQLDPHSLISGRSIEGTWGGASNPDTDIPRFAEFYQSGQMPLEVLVTNTYSLDEINKAMKDLESHKTGRPLIQFNSHIG